MPKLKSNRSARKRVRISKRGKVRHFKAGRGHLLTSKNAKRRRQLGRPAFATKTESRTIRRILPYGA